MLSIVPAIRSLQDVPLQDLSGQAAEGRSDGGQLITTPLKFPGQIPPQ